MSKFVTYLLLFYDLVLFQISGSMLPFTCQVVGEGEENHHDRRIYLYRVHPVQSARIPETQIPFCQVRLNCFLFNVLRYNSLFVQQ